MSTKRKLFCSLAVVVAVAVLGTLGTFAAFTATTDNTGNVVSSGTVEIAQHTGATTLYNVSNQAPGSGNAVQRCVRVTYKGSLAATVKLYASTAPGAGASNFNLQVERGSGITSPDNTMNCTGFSSAASLYNGDLSGFATNYTGAYDAKGSAWSTNNAVDYRFTIYTKDDTTANAHTSTQTSGTHTFTWEARNN